MNKALLLSAVLLLFSACVSQPTEQAKEAPVPQPKGGISEEALTRTSAGSAVSVDVTFLSPLQKNKDELVFRVALDTHSVDLLGFKIDKLSALKTSEGIEVKEGFVWVSESESSHHRSGYLKLPAKTLEGRPLISEKTEYIILEISGIEAARVFKWEREALRL